MTDEDNQELGVALTYWALGFFCGAVCVWGCVSLH